MSHFKHDEKLQECDIEAHAIFSTGVMLVEHNIKMALNKYASL